MASKCPFCRRKYIRRSVYEKHLGTANTFLDKVLTSTVGYQSSGDIIYNIETKIFYNPETSELQDSEYEYDPDPTGHELETFSAYEFDTEIPDNSTSSLPARPETYPHTREPIGDLKGFEQENSNVCEDLGAPFSCAQGFKLAS